MKRKALFPGSFDPFTVAHLDVLKRSATLFDEVVVSVGVNSRKPSLISMEDRLEMLKIISKSFPNVEASSYTGLTVNYCKEIGAQFMIRGIRDVADFEYERAIAQMNNLLFPDIESIFIVSKSGYSSFSSTIVRDVMRNKGDISPFVPAQILPCLAKYI